MNFDNDEEFIEVIDQIGNLKIVYVGYQSFEIMRDGFYDLKDDELYVCEHRGLIVSFEALCNEFGYVEEELRAKFAGLACLHSCADAVHADGLFLLSKTNEGVRTLVESKEVKNL